MGIEGGLKSQMGRKHALVIPVAFQSHIAGIYTLSIELAKRGVTITFVALEKDIKLLKTFDEVQELDWRMISYEDFGRRETSGDTVVAILPTLRNLFQPILDKLLEDQKAGLPGPTCIIGDNLLEWVGDIAKVLKVPYYQFFSYGAIYARYLQASSQLCADGTLTVIEEAGEKASIREFEGLLKIPGLPALHFGEIAKRFGAIIYNAIGHATGEADGVILNTFYELEAPQIDAIGQSWLDDSRVKIRKLFLVGPLLNAASFKYRSFVANSDNRGHVVYLEWLDRRPPQSVLYICFGTLVSLDAQQIKEVALAIEATEQPFLWVLPRGGAEALPSDFEARTKRKGLIARGWIPQLQILAHSSIGGFVTHCGWNSIIESISCGVPMVAWPQMSNDQFMNCRYLVDVLKIAVEVLRPQGPNCSVEEAITSTATSRKNNELERAVRILMSEEGNTLRSRIQDLKKKTEASVAEAGASKKALSDLVESILP